MNGLRSFMLVLLLLMLPSAALPQQSLVTLEAGWLEHRNGLTYSSTWPAYGSFFEFAKQPLSGVWLGADCSVAIDSGTTLGISCGWLFPVNRDTVLEESDGDRSRLSTDTQWGAIDAWLTYGFNRWGEAIVGFRWDHFTTRWNVVDLSPDAFYNHKLNAFLPYLGFQSRYVLPNMELAARIIGSPWAPGSMKFEIQVPSAPIAFASTQGYDEGYFLEGSLEYTYHVSEDTSVGAFASYNQLHFAGTGTVKQRPFDFDSEIELVFTRQSWTLGASVSVAFNLF